MTLQTWSVRATFQTVEADFQRAPGHLRPPVLRVLGQDGGGLRVLQIKVANVHNPVLYPDLSRLFHGSPFQEFPYLTDVLHASSTKCCGEDQGSLTGGDPHVSLSSSPYKGGS